MGSHADLSKLVNGINKEITGSDEDVVGAPKTFISGIASMLTGATKETANALINAMVAYFPMLPSFLCCIPAVRFCGYEYRTGGTESVFAGDGIGKSIFGQIGERFKYGGVRRHELPDERGRVRDAQRHHAARANIQIGVVELVVPGNESRAWFEHQAFRRRHLQRVTHLCP